jgi:hypothetical protein
MPAPLLDLAQSRAHELGITVTALIISSLEQTLIGEPTYGVLPELEDMRA